MDCSDPGPQPVKRDTRTVIEGLCCKCKQVPPIVLIRHANYCKSCFVDTVIHRFRSTCMKLRLVPKDAKTLVAVSGGASSLSLLHMLADFSSSNDPKEQKKLKFPQIELCYVDQSAVLPGMAGQPQELGELVERYGFNFHVIALEDMFSRGKEVSVLQGNPAAMQVEISSTLAGTGSPKEILQSSLAKITSLSNKEDVLKMWTHQRIMEFAQENGFNVVMLGENCSFIAQKVISMVAKGRGSTIPSEVAVELKNEDVTLVRPLRDISSKEIALFTQYQSLKSLQNVNLTTGLDAKRSIDRLTMTFLTGLENDFPSTGFTVTRTAAKIPGRKDRIREGVCPMCLGPRDTNVGDRKCVDEIMSQLLSKTLTLEDATNQPSSQKECISGDCTCETTPSCNTGCCSTSRPPVSLDISHFCYACQNILRELPIPAPHTSGAECVANSAVFFPGSVSKLVSRETMKKEIQDFMLD